MECLSIEKRAQIQKLCFPRDIGPKRFYGKSMGLFQMHWQSFSSAWRILNQKGFIYTHSKLATHSQLLYLVGIAHHRWRKSTICNTAWHRSCSWHGICVSANDWSLMTLRSQKPPNIRYWLNRGVKSSRKLDGDSAKLPRETYVFFPDSHWMENIRKLHFVKGSNSLYRVVVSSSFSIIVATWRMNTFHAHYIWVVLTVPCISLGPKNMCAASRIIRIGFILVGEND